MAQKPNELTIWNSNGLLVQSVKLNGITNVYHAIQASTDSIAACVAFNSKNNDETREVILVSTSGIVLKTFLGNDPWALDQPHYIATNETGSIYVADAGNNQILILDKDLIPIQAVPSLNRGIQPTRLQYRSGQLMVGQSYGTVQFIGDTYIEGLRISQPSLSSQESNEDTSNEDLSSLL